MGRVEAARLLARSRLSAEQLRALAPVLAVTGPVELVELLKLGKKLDAPTGRVWAESVARSPVFGALEESTIKSAFSSVPADIYEKMLAPAVRSAAAANDAKKRRLESLAAEAGKGRSSEGRKVFESSACLACHKAGGLGRALGPDLSQIGRIRSPRDLLESIIFPNATIARDYETHIIETSDGQTHTGMIKSDTPQGLVLLDIAGQEKVVPHAQIVANSLMATSLMPAGLEQTFSEQQLLDLVAWLGSLQ
jgi:putative heme-binding domain-containing protein